ncbi:MAG: hemolysin family protein [Spirochaetia bacterium]|nr:hemolysin family protein [Spirochaetia bacterium]
MLLGSFIFLLFLSAFFSATETAFTSLSFVTVKMMGESKSLPSRLVARLMKRQDLLLGTILLGNNLVNIAATSIATAYTIARFSDAAVTIATLAVTVIVLIFGEVTPKQVALAHNEFFAKAAAFPMSVLIPLFSPFVYSVMIFSKVITRLISWNKAKKPVSLEAILHMVSLAEDVGVVEEYENDMVKMIFRLNDIPVSSIMTHRTEVFSLDAEMTIGAARQVLKESPTFSRIPIYDKDSENIRGIVLARDILTGEYPDLKLKSIEYNPIFVSETKKVSELFAIFKIKKLKMAVVLDEYGGLAGIVTQEDVVEEITGELYDEDEDRAQSRLIRLDENTYLLNGDLPIDIFSGEVDADLVPSRYSQTMAGYIFETLGKIPLEGESVFIPNGKLTVRKMDGNQIVQILFKKVKKTVDNLNK